MLLDWFNTKEAVFVGIKLADNLSAELAKVNNKLSKKEVVNSAIVIKKVFSQFDGFEGKANLNFYKKSKLVNEFRWRLVETGHDKEFIEVMVQELVFYINQLASKVK